MQDAKSDLNDSYYSHSRDAQSQALDDEQEAYALSKEKYIERLEEQLEETETLIQNSIMDVMLNADTVYNELNELADLYGVDLSDSLTQPWKDASAQAIKWKDELKASMESGDYAALIGEGGAITAFANGVATKLQGSWTKTQTAAENYAGYLTGAELKNRFSSTITGFGNQIQTIIDKWNGVKEAADKAYVAQTRKVEVGGNDTGGGDKTGNDTPTQETPKTTTKKVTSAGKNSSTIQVGSKTYANSKKVTINGTDYYKAADGYYYPMSSLQSVGKERDGTKIYGFPGGTTRYSYSAYAKGTTGVKRDEIANVDELGPELIMHANPATGRLEYLTKGSSVIPHDATVELLKLADVGVNGLMDTSKFGANINMISNAISKPEFNITFDSLVRAENITEETLPAVKKLVTEELNRFTKELNYSIRKFAR